MTKFCCKIVGNIELAVNYNRAFHFCGAEFQSVTESKRKFGSMGLALSGKARH